MRALFVTAAVIALVLGAACDDDSGEGTEQTPPSGETLTPEETQAVADPGGLEFELVPEGAAEISGRVGFSSLDNATTVLIELTTAPADEGDLPAEIMRGTCENLEDEGGFALEDVREGTSTTRLNATIEELQESDYAVVVYGSEEDVDTPAACGNIPRN